MNQRRRHSASKKVEILREHLENGVSVSELAGRYHINPNLIHKWKKEFFENAVETFGNKQRRSGSSGSGKVDQLQKKLKDKDSLIAEIMEDNIRLKKKLNGDI